MDQQQEQDTKLTQDDGVTYQNVNQSRTEENDSERDVYQVSLQDKVETIWLFDKGVDGHVMPKHVWEQLGEPLLQTTRVMLRGANGQDIGAMQVRRFVGKTKVQFTAVVARDARRCLLSGTQLRTKEYTFTLNRQKKGDDVTRRKRRHSQGCVHAEAKRCTVGNLPDIDTRERKCETIVAKPQDWSA